jgi:predicted nucleic acid-binding protein
MKVFFDTSAFVKRYIDEPGSNEVIKICRQADLLILSIICLPEMISTLSRLVREEIISAKDYRQTKLQVLKELEAIEICNLTAEVIKRAISCLESSPLRAMDALHLSCALVMNPDLFVSSDTRQIIAANKEGLKVLEV